MLFRHFLLALDTVGLAAAVLAGTAGAGLAELAARAGAAAAARGAGVELAQPQQHGLGGARLGGQAGQGGDAAGGVQGEADQLLAFGLGGRQLVEPGALGDHRVDQAAVACLDARPARQGAQGGGLVLAQLAGGGLVDRLVGHGAERGVAVAILRGGRGGHGGEPEVEVAVEAALGQHVELGRQAQRGHVHARARDAFVGAGDALQQAAPRAMLVGGGGRQAQAGVAAEGAEEHARGLLDVAQADRRLGEVSAGGAGDEAVPEQAYGFFHGVSDP